MVETVAGKSTLTHDHPNYAGPIGVTGSTSANAVAAAGRRRHGDRDAAPGLHDGLVVGVRRPGHVRFVAVNTASWDAHKQGAQPVVGDAKVSLEAIDAALGTHAAPPEWLATADERIADGTPISTHGPGDA